MRRWKSLPSDLDLWDHLLLPLTPADTPTSTPSFTWTTGNEAQHQPPTPPPTPTDGPAPGAGGGWVLGRAVGWIRNRTSEKSSQASVFSVFK